MNGSETRYRARVSGIGDVKFQTSDRLSPQESRRLISVHPWIHDLRDPLDGSDWRASDNGIDEFDSESGEGYSSSLLNAVPIPCNGCSHPRAAVDCPSTTTQRRVQARHCPVKDGYSRIQLLYQLREGCPY